MAGLHKEANQAGDYARHQIDDQQVRQEHRIQVEKLNQEMTSTSQECSLRRVVPGEGRYVGDDEEVLGSDSPLLAHHDGPHRPSLLLHSA